MKNKVYSQFLSNGTTPDTLQRKATEALMHLLTQSLGTLASGGLISSVSGSLLPLSLQLEIENKYLTLLNICH